MLKGFQDFILRGNVIELSIAVVMGAAFTAIVSAISDHVIKPAIAAIGTPDTSALAWTIRPGNAATTIDLGAVLSAAIQFLIVAAVVYFCLIAPMNAMNERREKGAVEETAPAGPSDVELLTEIRDLLRAGQHGTSGQHSTSADDRTQPRTGTEGPLTGTEGPRSD